MYADAAPGFEKEAFQIALQHYFEMEQYGGGKDISKPRKKESKQKNKEPENKLEIILNSNYDWSLTNIPKLQPIDQYLHMLQIAKKEFGIDKLSTDEIRKILYEKFRITKTVNNIGMTLMKKVGNYVDRIKVGNGYYYKITSNGENYLKEGISGD